MVRICFVVGKFPDSESRYREKCFVLMWTIFLGYITVLDLYCLADIWTIITVSIFITDTALALNK
jgi:hypothetical protein